MRPDWASAVSVVCRRSWHVYASVRVRAGVCVCVCFAPAGLDLVNNLIDDYSHGVVHDFGKPTENAIKKTSLRKMSARAMHIR